MCDRATQAILHRAHGHTGPAVGTRLPAASMARKAARAVTVMKTGADTGNRKRWRLPARSGNTP